MNNANRSAKRALRRRLRRDPRFWAYLNRSGPPRHIDPVGLTERQLEYREYLLSDHWAQFKARILNKRGPQCEQCGTAKGPIDVHHLTYERLGQELVTDVEVLCRNCHQKRHDKPRVELNHAREGTGGTRRNPPQGAYRARASQPAEGS